jgi:ribosomal protein L37AE/L43A
MVDMIETKQVEKRCCNKCNSKVAKSDLKEYSYQCMECDEDLYEFETHISMK